MSNANLSKKIYSPIAVSVLLFFYYIIFSGYVIYGGANEFVPYLPDDAFYYHILARNFSQYGWWTFDGQSVTTGFHLLYAYSLSLCYYVFGDFRIHKFLVGYTLLSSACVSYSFYLFYKALESRFENTKLIASMALFYILPVVVYQILFMMEAPFVILLASICFYIQENSTSKVGFVVSMLIGIVGSLFRSDFVLIPLTLVASNFIMLFDSSPDYRARLKKSAYILFGSLLGLSLISVHNYILTGAIVQASAQVKLYWSSLPEYNNSLAPAFSIFLKLLFPFKLEAFSSKLPFFLKKGLSYLFYLFTIILMVSFVYGTIKRNNIIKQLPYLLVVFFNVIFVLAIYRLDSAAIDLWYVGTYFLGGLLFFVIIFQVNTKSITVKLIKFLYASIILVTSFYVVFLPPYPHHMPLYEAGKLLKGKINGNVASWNSGMIAYFSGINVINIDGLVNNDVFQYVKNSNLPEYIHNKNILYLVDYDSKFTTVIDMIRGGYPDALYKCLTPYPLVPGVHINLVDQACVERLAGTNSKH